MKKKIAKLIVRYENYIIETQIDRFPNFPYSFRADAGEQEEGGDNPEENDTTEKETSDFHEENDSGK